MRIFALALLLIAALGSEAGAAERITNFVTEANVSRDASVTFKETISVIAEGSSIRHGIFRDIPTRYRDRNGFNANVGLDVLKVRRDGYDEPYSVESIANGKRIKIGSADALVDPGPHTYEITYLATRVLGFFDQYDELYWNVTGNAWAFPIAEAQAIINLPPGASITQHAEYTGAEGEQGRQYEVLAGTGNRYRARTTAALRPGEGFTVAVAWPKGFVAAPSESERWQWFLGDNAPVIVLVIGLIIVGFYYFYAWLRVGRDPPAGIIVPLFAPPPGLGPAAVRYVWREKFDDRTFAAAVVGLAVKGRVRIVDDGGDFIIEKHTGAKGEALTHAESDLYNALPPKLVLKQSNHSTVSAVRTALGNSLSKDFDGVLFFRNRGWFWMGAVLSIAVLAVMVLFLPAEDAATGLMITFFGAIWWGIVLAFLTRAVSSFFLKGIMHKLGSILLLLFLVPFVLVGVAAPALFLAGLGSPGLYTLVAAAVLLAGFNVLFFWLLKAPTVAGRKILDQLEGFRMYLKTAEEDRLQVLNPPDKTPDLFERFLPYALALDCENEWNAKFTAVLAAAAAAGATAPVWYSGSNWDAGRTTSFTDSLGSSLASSTAAASTAPGSSSGSGGGGSSGGGGGGGGGGGW
jgi:uncharacterized membrane protein YgcG